MAKQAKHVVTVPQNTNEANLSLTEIGSLSRSIEAAESAFAAKVAKLRQEVDAEIAPLTRKFADLTLGLQAFAEANRETLLPDNKKTVKLSAGSFGWRYTPPKVVLGKGGEKKALETVKALDLTQYVRTKEELNKEALLEDKPEIPGIKYRQKEEFFVDPKPEIESNGATVSNVIALKAA